MADQRPMRRAHCSVVSTTIRSPKPHARKRKSMRRLKRKQSYANSGTSCALEMRLVLIAALRCRVACSIVSAFSYDSHAGQFNV